MNQRKATSKLSDGISEITKAIAIATIHEELNNLLKLFAAQSKLGRARNSMSTKIDDTSNKHIKQAGRIHNLTKKHTELQAVHEQNFDQRIEKIELHNRQQEQRTTSIETNQGHHTEILT